MSHPIRWALVCALVASLVLPAVAQAHWPVANRRSYISSGYWSWRGDHYHRAIDIAAPLGTRIFPWRSGTVIYAGWKSNGGGYQVWVRSPRVGLDVYSIYMHMRYRPRVHRGDHVYPERTVLGYVGSTGHSSGPHLHLQVWIGWPWGRYSHTVNPWPGLIKHGAWLPYRYL